jgi:hypothetical protein
VTDLAEHYSQLASYMRLIGLTPPSALPPKPRKAIDLPTSVLLKDVGSYDLPPSAFQGSPACGSMSRSAMEHSTSSR